MSSHKRKAAAAGSSQISETVERILGSIAKVKPKLADLGRKDVRNALLEELQHLAALGETLSEKRQRTKITPDVADILDREGVHLWNVSRLSQQGAGSDEDRSLIAALRLSSFRLIEAGIEQKPGVETLINVLQLASKTGTALSESGRNDVAASVLGSAAKFEEQLRNAEDVSNGAHDQAKARAAVLYYCSRMLTAWRDGNHAIAQFMLEKITGAAPDLKTLFSDGSHALIPLIYPESDEKRLSLITIPDRELLAAKIMEIGRSNLKVSGRISEEGTAGLADAKKALDSVKWLQKAFTLVEKMEDSESPGILELKRGILRCLVRAYCMSSVIEAENLVRAETTLQELVASIDGSLDRTNPEHHQLRWMRVGVLKKTKAPESAMSEALASIVDHSVFTESEITESVTNYRCVPYAALKNEILLLYHSLYRFLQELRTLTQQHQVVSDVLHRCIQRLLDGPAEQAIFVDRVFLSLLAHCAKDQDNSRAIKGIETACASLIQSEYELQKTPAMACLTILWKVGDRHYQMKKYSQAAEWFLAGTHKAFSSIGQMSGPKSLRKAALCYIEQREYAQASQIIRRCPSNQSSTFYLQFLTAVYQGLEDDAIAAIQSMASAPDFDRKMLLLATQLSHESDLKNVLLASLEALLNTLRSHGPMDSDIEAICLARCIIRLVIRLMKEAPVDTDRVMLVSSLVGHFETASSLVETAIIGKNAPLIAKDVSWLWRTAYNIAVQGCSEWQHAETQIGNIFEISYKLAHAYSRIAVGNTEADVYVHMAYSSFSCVSARMFALRYSTKNKEDKIQQQGVVLKDTQKAKDAIASVKERIGSSDQPESQNLDDLLHSIYVFEAEIFCQRQEWDKLLEVIIGIGSRAATVSSYEAIADMLWSNSDCPVNVLYVALEALLHSCLDRGRLSVEKFSRWLRAICTILLSRNTHTDRTKAVSYVEQALAVLEDQSTNVEPDEVYPMDERQWLLSISYNTGVECLAASYIDEAKRWFEAATIACRSVPDGVRHSERISETYRRLLDQYAPQAL